MKTDTFTGEIFSTKSGSVLEVKEVSHKTNYIKSYILTCSVCSKDKELWPYGSITSTKGSLMKGSLPCGCTRSPRWSEDQWMVKILRVCEERDITFIGVAEKWRGKETKLKLKNNTTGNVWESTTVNGLVNRGKGDPMEGIRRRNHSRTREVGEMIQCFEGSGNFISGCEFHRIFTGKGRGLWEFVCPICKFDNFVTSCGSPSSFITLGSTLLAGCLPCRCSKGYKWNKKEQIYRVEEFLKDRGDLFINEVHPYKGSKTDILWFSQDCGHKNISSINKILGGQRCSTCHKGGYSKGHRGVFYITRWVFDEGSYLKYGITNVDARSRCLRHKRGSLGDPHFEILHEFSSDNGEDAALCESKVKLEFSSEVGCERELLPEGFTETVKDTPENLNMILQIISTFNLK